MNPLLVVLGIAWSSTNTALGLLLAIMGGAVPHRRLPAGVWQWTAVHGSWRFWSYFFLHWKKVAFTLGQISIVHPYRVNDPVVIRHERQHTIQGWKWGPIFPGVYVGEWAYELRKDHGDGEKAYEHIPLEVAAYAAEKLPDAFG